MSDEFDSLRLKLMGGKSLTDAELAIAAKELGMPIEEIRLMIERAQSAGMSFKSYKSTSGLNRVATALKSKKPAIHKVDQNLVGGMVQPPVNDSATEEEIPDVVKEAAKVLGMEPEALFNMIRTKAVYGPIAGGIPDGSETRAKRRERMSTPLKDGVKGKLLSLLHPDFPQSAIKEAISNFTQAEKEEALSIMSSVQELLGIPLVTHKSTGSEWLDDVYDKVTVQQFKSAAEKQFGSNVYTKLTEIRMILSPQPMDRFTSKQLNNSQPNTKYLPLAEQNKQTHPLVQAEMEKLNQTTLKTMEAKVGAEKQTGEQQQRNLHDAFTSVMLNPQLETQLKESQQQAEVNQARLYDAFTSKKLNPDKQPELQTTLKEAQHDTITIEQSIAAKEAARLRKWQSEQPVSKPKGAPFLPGNL